MTASPNGTAPGTAAAGLGQTVTDGHFSFVVDRVQCGVGTLVSEFDTGTPAQGQFCVAVLTMTNITNVPQFVPPEGTMTDTNGNTFNTTSDIPTKVAAQAVYLGADHNVELEVNPGSHYADVYVYDVPTGVKAGTLTLFGSVGSSGAKVSVTGGQAAPPASTAAASSAPAPSTAAAPSTAGVSSPRDVVQQYFAAIDAGDYARAWSLGGRNIHNGSYNSFVQGFSGTSYDAVTIVYVNGDTVGISLDATQTNGTHKYYSGTYTVRNGVIVAADVH